MSVVSDFLRWARPEVEETVSLDEAIGYGVNTLTGIAKYIIYIIILIGIGSPLLLIGIDDEWVAAIILGIPFVIAGIILIIVLTIGVMYKILVDILARSRE